jgi:hypothetical protein
LELCYPSNWLGITVHKSQDWLLIAALDVSQVFLPGQAMLHYRVCARIRRYFCSVAHERHFKRSGCDGLFVEQSFGFILANALHFETKFYPCYRSNVWLGELAQNGAITDSVTTRVSGKSKHALWAQKQNEGHRTALDPSKIHFLNGTTFALKLI